jgi:hypothetical protein
MTKRGRKPGFRTTDAQKSLISNSMIMSRLIAFCEGKEGVEMSNAQVTASVALLRKVIPDMLNTENTTSIDGNLKLTKTIETTVIEQPQDDATDTMH